MRKCPTAVDNSLIGFGPKPFSIGFISSTKKFGTPFTSKIFETDFKGCLMR
jgi:hypothetical protein